MESLTARLVPTHGIAASVYALDVKLSVRKKNNPLCTCYIIAIYATSCKMSVFFALDMTIGPRVSASDPTCRVQKNSHFATSFIQDFF
jgi:hypothetical protein